MTRLIWIILIYTWLSLNKHMSDHSATSYLISSTDYKNRLAYYNEIINKYESEGI